MSVTLRAVDPVADAPTITTWVAADRASFWGMGDLGEEDVVGIYRYIDEQNHLAAHVLEVDAVPIGLLQTYDPAVDEIGAFYDRRPGDVGVHLLLSDAPARIGRTAEVLAAGFRFLTDLPGMQRLVLEPDVRNEASLALLDRLGAVRGPRVDLRTSISEKPAQFFFIDRDRALEVGRSGAGVQG